MQAIKNMTIGSRLAFAFSLLLLLLVGMALLAAFQATRLWGAAEKFDQQVSPSSTAVFQFSNAIKDLRRLEAQIILYVPDAAELPGLDIPGSIVKASGQAEDALRQYEKLAFNSDDQRNLAELKSLLATYAAERGKVVAAAQASATDPAQTLAAKKLMWLGPSRQAFTALSKSFEEWRVRSQDVGQKAAEAARATYTQALWWLGFFVLLSLTVGIIAAITISRSITLPLAQAVRVAQNVAAGDLTSRVEVSGKDETSQLLMALRDMNAWLVDVVGQVRHSSDHIATGSAEIASGNADLSQRTETQASNLQQTAASMEELTSTVSQSASTAREANQLALSASKAATDGGVAVGQVVTTMAAITQSSKKIADIIGVIDGIAFQTNILALNAAVEAARAGEQGRGFAVVASEVRSLAQRSANAAKEIKTLINDSVEKVDIGSRQVSDAGQSMDSIVAQVRRVSQLIGEISAAASEQTTGIAQVSDAINQLDHVTQQNAALVEQSAAAADSLKQQGSRLSSVVANFKLDAGHLQLAS